MDLVNDLSSDVALAVLVEGTLRQKLDVQDAKSFIALLEAELSRISREEPDSASTVLSQADLSH
jgi:hypothetical protein